MSQTHEERTSAFPLPPPSCSPQGDVFYSEGNGLTLRDYFAAKAMAGWLASYSPETPALSRSAVDQVATLAYDVADAMLVERSVRGSVEQEYLAAAP